VSKSRVVTSPLRAALFDFGDTLFYSPDGAQVMVEAGVDATTAALTWSEIWRASRSSESQALKRDLSPALHRAGWLGLFSPAESLLPGLAELLYERVMTVELWTPYPDAHRVLRGLHRRGVPVGVVSNVASDLRPVFRRHGLEGYVAAFVHSYEHEMEKPDPRLFQVACARLDVEPVRTLMVGDSHLGDGGALAAGLTVLLLPPVPRGSSRGLDLAVRLVA
jgi:HAD superfamily hydrolase (TIGR01509 family)